MKPFCFASIPFRQARTAVAGCTIAALAGVLSLPLSNLAMAESPAVPEGFTALFNGKDLTGWHGQPHLDPRKWDATPAEKRSEWNQDMSEHWTVKEGALVNDGHGVYLTTDKQYGDIELLIDYKTVALADSGIYLRGSPQVQIWDSTNEAQFGIGADKGSGGLWNNSPGKAGKDPLVLADKAFGEWNSFRIKQVGARTSVWLNDQLVVDGANMENYWDRELPLFAKGVIQLQTHGGEIQWRNLFIRELSAEESNQWLQEQDQKLGEFQSLFNGSDLSNWKGAVENYEVLEGAIQCKTGHGGVLHTADKYSDFETTLEFQLPPGGNNGLALRYPGSGDTAYLGMCELQVLDNTADKYSGLDQRQYHGSAYGMLAAKRGFLREVGEWNYQRVTVKGSTIRVELNGTVILDGDLSQVTEYLADKEHPGKDNADGYFGFAGHNDPVRFKNVHIRGL
ncbi:3-keto-disaccharide hydrolase [Aureliella helgolandensis]|uniref:3-keto-alpha-glucoside-1,2-lyase/3-keto-2-hydroxy-glucal hydratase domain-containing protein n=1 Tax=Aureliella helgolandensis TaxID=2527968 RepID=A0A518GHQ0_9BACT|nr:DUF1080 domain-containing protein [Aureliella helgolandensis]QDV28122.1 hypothetical protein Q31a_65170 [Aureliella helgolandensis]